VEERRVSRQREALAKPEVRRSFEEEVLFGEATDTIAALLESMDISQRELAQRLSLTEGRISQILSGSENLTLRTLAAIGWALGVRFELDPTPMADRSGTPAEQDAPAPAWLAEFKRPAALSLPDLVSGILTPLPSHPLLIPVLAVNKDDVSTREVGVAA
jgi:transcriptional regulator with XRE-family HTH domain